MTVTDKIRDIVFNELSAIDDRLLEIIDDIEQGNLSPNEIASSLEELRKNIW